MDSRKEGIVKEGQNVVAHFLDVSHSIFPSWSVEERLAYLFWAIEPILDEESVKVLSFFGVRFSNAFPASLLEEANEISIQSYIHFEDAALHVADILFRYIGLEERECRSKMECIKKDRVDRLLDLYPALEILKQ